MPAASTTRRSWSSPHCPRTLGERRACTRRPVSTCSDCCATCSDRSCSVSADAVPTRFFSTSCSLPSTLVSDSLQRLHEILDGFLAAVEVHPGRLLELGQRGFRQIEERLVVLSERIGGECRERFAQLLFRILEQGQLLGGCPALGGQFGLEPRAGSRRARLQAATVRRATSRSACARMTNQTLMARQQTKGDQAGDDEGHDTKFRRRRREVPEEEAPAGAYDRDHVRRTDSRRGPALRPSPHTARRRRRGTTAAQGGARALHRCGRSRARRRRCISRPRVSARSGSWTTTSLTSAIFSARSSMARRMLVDRSSSRHRDRLRDINPHTKIEPHDVRFGESERAPPRLGVRRHRRRHRQLSDALSRQRCLRPCRPPECLRQYLRASKGRRRCSPRRTGPATAACIPSRPRQASSRAAPKAASSACFRASSERFRRPRRSN